MKILIIRFSHLGDIVLTQPIVQRLYKVFPEAELYYLTKEQYQEIPKFFGIPLQVLTYSKLLESFSGLRKKQFDLVFDLQNKLNSFLIKSVCVRAKTFTYNKQRSLRTAIVKHKTEQDINSTMDLYHSALTEAADNLHQTSLAEKPENPILYPDQAKLKNMQNRLKRPDGKKIIALFPGATHNTKMYPAVSFIELIKKSGDTYHFWLLGNAAEKDLTYQIYFETADKSTNLGGAFDLEEMIHVIAISDAVVTNDSGPMHIAAALGKPQIAIFGSTHPRLGFRPLNEKAIIISQDLSCQPCSLHGQKACPLKHFNCMKLIEPEIIVSILKKLL